MHCRERWRGERRRGRKRRGVFGKREGGGKRERGVGDCGES